MKLPIASVILTCLLASPAAWAVTWPAITDPESGVSIKAEAWLDTKPGTGYVPVTVQIENSSTSAGGWLLHSTNTSYRFGTAAAEATISVPAGSSQSSTFLMPVGAFSYEGSGSFETCALNITGHGIVGRNLGTLVQSGDPASYFALSKAGCLEWPWLKKQIAERNNSSNENQGSEVDSTRTPEDWRGLTGLDFYWLSESEYAALSAAQKAAVADWVILGGQVLTSGTSDAGSTRLGLGQFSTHPAAGKQTQAEAEKQYLTPFKSKQHQGRAEPESSTALRDLVGKQQRVSGFIFLFVLLFGLLIGPVNLFWLADVRHRHRLFWTTPLISLAGSGFLLGLMLFQDGVGGRGARLTLGIMAPQEKRLGIRQEQISKTGVLLSSSFSIAEPCFMQQVPLKDIGYSGKSMDNLYHERGNIRSGKWFQSRNIQQQILQTVRPTRGAIHFTPAAGAAGPSVLSSFEARLSTVFIIDDAGKVWTATDLHPGERKPLTAASPTKFVGRPKDWASLTLPKLSAAFVSGGLEQLVANQKSIALAEVQDSEAPKLAIGTLDGIDWSTDKAMLVGPYLLEPAK